MTDFIIGLIAFGMVGWAGHNYRHRDEANVYTMSCNIDSIDGKCTEGELPGAVFTYKANFEQQTVVFWTENSPPKRFKKCAVRDNENWSCRYSESLNDSFEYQMIDGKYSELHPPYYSTTFFPVSRWQWWWRKFKSL